MGNRVKGRTKRKSVKAASHSGMGSKRKLSRMGKKQKAGNSGFEYTFIGRAKCLKMLQITLKDFRRLCILKGIYPREPRNTGGGGDKTSRHRKKSQILYHIKDIKAISHEPILYKFREFKAFMKKIRKASGRNEKEEAIRMEANAPSYTLHHLVKERYPRFSDALNDLDDALALIYLFASLPSAHKIKTKITRKAKELCAAWTAYCAYTSSITKSFISVKGIYIEAEIANLSLSGNSATDSVNHDTKTSVRWIIPHAFTQHLPNDVDYRVMITFFEFYEVLLGFVLYKLYNDLGVRYPLQISHYVERKSTSMLSAHLYTLSRNLRESLSKSQGAVSEAVSQALEDENMDTDEKKEKETKKKASSKKSKELMKTVDIALQKLKGQDSDSDDDSDDDSDADEEGKVDISSSLKEAFNDTLLDSKDSQKDGNGLSGEGADSSMVPTIENLSEEATKRKCLFHNLVFFLSREVPRGYLELIILSYGGKVGWEGDDSPISMKDPSITHHIVDRPKLPSSLNSLKDKGGREFIQPQWILDCANFMFLLPIHKYAVAAELPPHLSPWVDNEEEGYTPAYAEEIEKLKNGEAYEVNEDGDDDDESVAEEDEEETVNKRTSTEENKESNDTASESDDSDDENSEEEEEETEAQKEEKRKLKRKLEDEETHDLAKLMMSKKAKRLYGRMQHGLSEKQTKVEELQRRRKDIEEYKKRDKKGRTPNKQKVDRLKEERKAVLSDYDKGDNLGSMKKSKKNKKQKK